MPTQTEMAGYRMLAEITVDAEMRTRPINAGREEKIRYVTAALFESPLRGLVEAVTKALDDSETGDGWGPDITVATYLRTALAEFQGESDE